uniref:Uncharacterized protein n=1 Tax=Panagrolaimus sp. PS1159 TaxID=55785 RepID=A0AC35GY81_9BILA
MRSVEIRRWSLFWITVSFLCIFSKAEYSARLAFIDMTQMQSFHEPLYIPRRIKRQAYPPNPAPFQPRMEDYNLPPHYQV